MSCPWTNTQTNFWLEPQTPLAGLHFLRNPETTNWYSSHRPFCPGMGNESDTYLRHIQKPFLKANKAGKRPSWSGPPNSYPNHHLVSEKLVEDYFAERKPVRKLDDDLMDNEEYRDFIKTEMSAKGLSPGHGVLLEQAVRKSEADFEFAKKNMSQTKKPETNDTSHKVEGFENDDTNAADMATRDLESFSPEPSQNEINRAAGLSYIYTIDDSDDLEDDKEDEDDFHLYAHADVMPSKELSLPASNKDDSNIDFSDSDSDSSDEDSYFSHVAIAGLSPTNNPPTENHNGCSDDNNKNTQISYPNVERPYYEPTLPTILEQDEKDALETAATRPYHFDDSDYSEDGDDDDDFDHIYSYDGPQNKPIGSSEQTKSANQAKELSQSHGAMTRFNMACDNDAIIRLANALMIDIIEQKESFTCYKINHLTLVNRQQGPGNERLTSPTGSCPWGLVPLDPTPDKLYPPLTEAPGIILTNPDGDRFELEERSWNFDGPHWAEYFEEREELNRQAQFLERDRRTTEPFGEYKKAIDARRYWAQAQEERDDDLYWQGVHQRAWELQEREKSAAAAATTAKQEDEEDTTNDNDTMDSIEDKAGSQYTISEPSLLEEHRPVIIPRRLSDPELYCQTWKCEESDSDNDCASDCQENFDTNSNIDHQTVWESDEDDEMAVCISRSLLGQRQRDFRTNIDSSAMIDTLSQSTDSEESSILTSIEIESDESDFDDISLFDIDQAELNNNGTRSRDTTPDSSAPSTRSPSPPNYDVDLATFELETSREELRAFEAEITSICQSAKSKYEQWKEFTDSEVEEKKLYDSKLHWVLTVRHFVSHLVGLSEDGLSLDKHYQGPGVRFISASPIGAKEVLITGALAEFVSDLASGPVYINLRLLSAWLRNNEIRIQGRNNTALFAELKEMFIVKGTVARRAVDTYMGLMEQSQLPWVNPLRDVDVEYQDLNDELERIVEAEDEGREVEKGRLVAWEVGRECFSVVVRDRDGNRVEV